MFISQAAAQEIVEEIGKEIHEHINLMDRNGFIIASIFSIGSDGTDGPTDAAGGYSDNETAAKLAEKGISIFSVLQDNDAYHALKETDGLIITGATGTNVNDFAALLIKR